MMAPHIQRQKSQTANIIINTNQAQVWDVLKVFNDVYTWAPGVEVSNALGNKRQQVGAGRYCKLADFGEIEEYITRWEEGTGFVYNVTSLGPLTNGLSSWWLTAVEAKKTRLNVEFAYDLRYGLLGRTMHQLIMKNKLKRSLQDTLTSLKKRVETGEMFRPLLQAAA